MEGTWSDVHSRTFTPAACLVARQRREAEFGVRQGVTALTSACHLTPQPGGRGPAQSLACSQAGKTGPGPRTASSCIGIRQKAKAPPWFALNEAMTRGGMASKTEPL